MTKLVAFLATFILASTISYCAATPHWNDLKVTFSLNIFSRYGFNRIERTRTKVQNNMNWVPLLGTTSCENTIGEFTFYGTPMTETGDNSVVSLYDKNGVIAGIMALYPHDEVLQSKFNNYRYDLATMLQNVTLNGRKYFVSTAYFIRPDMICSEGRSENDLDTQGTGDALFFQNGPTPSHLISAPLKRKKAIQQGWNKNNCFHAMGYHNFFNMTHVAETNCTESRPVFLLFNSDEQLHGFGFVIPGLTTKSSKFEHAPNFAIKRIIGNPPQCVLDQNERIGATSLHVYFINRPQLLFCPLW